MGGMTGAGVTTQNTTADALARISGSFQDLCPDLKVGVQERTWKGRESAPGVGPHYHCVARNETWHSEIRGSHLMGG